MAALTTRGQHAPAAQNARQTISSQTQQACLQAGERYFSEEYLPHWQAACHKLINAGYGAVIPLSYMRHSPQLVRPLNAKAAINLAASVSLAAIKTNRATAEMLPKAAVIAALAIPSVAGFTHWLNTIEQLLKTAPEAVSAVLERTQKIMSVLTPAQFHAWVLTGLRSTGKDALRQIAYFSFTDAAAEKWFRHAAGDIVFTDLARRLKLYLLALWQLQPPLRNLPASPAPLSARRITVANGVIQAPEIFPGFHGLKAEQIFRAGLAHAGAHLMFSRQKFTPGQLKPIQIALISLLEDARVEYLAIQLYPGLQKLWLPFHTAKPDGPQLAPLLLARLSRALLDQNYQDENGWVQKGRAMFFDSDNDYHDPAMCSTIGSLLGNDLGQLRTQFNARAYVVEPPYRDDNMGLWDFADQQDCRQDDQAVFIEAARINQQQSGQQQNDHDAACADLNQQHNRARPGSPTDRRKSGVMARYPEYDYVTGQERPDWARIVEYFPVFADAGKIDRMLAAHADLVNRITRLIKAAKVSLPVRLPHQSAGESLDLDACIDAAISLRAGRAPDPRIYSATQRKQRDLSVLVLLDISNSTNDPVPGASASVLELEIQATAILAYTMSALGDPFAIAAFCSDGKEDVHYYRIKDFNSAYDARARAYLAGLKGQLSTRIGVAIRHAANDLMAEHSHRRLLLVISDGEPADIDVDDRNYLVEDAQKAVRRIARAGIDTFCVGLDSGGDNYLHSIFGKKNTAVIDRLERLPERLPMLYLRLTA